MTDSNDLSRLAGLALILLVITTVLAEFAGIGSIGDPRIKMLLTWATVLLLGNEARRILMGGLPINPQAGGTRDRSGDNQDQNGTTRDEPGGRNDG